MFHRSTLFAEFSIQLIIAWRPFLYFLEVTSLNIFQICWRWTGMPQSRISVPDCRLWKHGRSLQSQSTGRNNKRPGRYANASPFGTWAYFGTGPPRHLILHPVPRGGLRGYGSFWKMYYPVDVRFRHATKNAWATQSNDSKLSAQFCRTFLIHDERGAESK